MEQKTFISDSDKALATLIWACLENDSDTKNLISTKENIAFCSPKEAHIGTKKLSLFLYNITEEKNNFRSRFCFALSFYPIYGKRQR